MLRLITGRAGTGKTAFIMRDIKSRMENGETGLYLIVPEQYSHDAERRLCKVCGDTLPLHGETLSFTRLAGRVFIETGGAAENTLDPGGQMLVMRRAMAATGGSLKVFCKKGHSADFLEKMMAAVREFKSCAVTPQRLWELSELTGGALSEKLHDLSVLYGAYESYFGKDAADPSDRLDKLAQRIGESSIGTGGHMFFDGFNDFTKQETVVIEQLLKKGADITVALTCEGLDGGGEVFELSRKTAVGLINLAKKHGVSCSREEFKEQTPRNTELRFIERELFNYTSERYAGESRGAVTVYAAPGVYSECEHAAKTVLELVRSGEYRWRDIGVMTRNWQEYGAVCENVFSKYGVQFFQSGRTDITEKPPCALIDAALEIAVTGWSYRAVFRYLKTGLPGVSVNDCAELENYVIYRNIRGGMWTRGNWTLPPQNGSADTLARLNKTREMVTTPLLRLSRRMADSQSAAEKLRVLYDFFVDISLPGRIIEKAEDFTRRGELRLAEEYGQLWDIIIKAMEQFFDIAGDITLDTAEFRRMFSLLLSQYDVGAIPVSLDRTVIGDMRMCRRRDLKCLIVLGASEDNLPMLNQDAGVLSSADREKLLELDPDIPQGQEERYCREMSVIYSTLTLPSQKLVLTYPLEPEKRPSFIVRRIISMLGIAEQTLSEYELLTSAAAPCFELAFYSNADKASIEVLAAREYFTNLSQDTKDRLDAADRFFQRSLKSLTPGISKKLYGEKPFLSASLVEDYYSCAFAHFLKSGLRLTERVAKQFDAPEAGTFTHFILEGVLNAAPVLTGDERTDEGICAGLTEQIAANYVKKYMPDYDDKTKRFKYLFSRLTEDTRFVALDMLRELENSEFRPLEFEYKFTDKHSELYEGLKLTGKIDRIDGWEYDNKLFLRVADYKTGKKQFILSDVVNGLGMQMLIYLFALVGTWKNAVPSGVLYVPSREIIVKADSRDITDAEILKAREKELRRGGIILDDERVIEAMEHGETKKYLPVKSGALVSREDFSALSAHVNKMLVSAAEEITGGKIECRPYYKDDTDNACMYCKYGAVCAFCEENGDKRRFLRKLSADEVWAEIKVEGDGK